MKSGLPNFVLDQLIWVRDHDRQGWEERRFAGWSTHIDSYVRCWYRECSSTNSSAEQYSVWYQWSINNPNITPIEVWFT